MIDSYITPLPSVVVPRWVTLAPGLLITHHPIEDPQGPGLAHLTYRDALALADRLGARLPTRAEVLELHELAAAAGTEIAPVILPDAHLRAQGCVPGDPRMVTRAWCDRHDAAVLLAIAGLADQETAVANAGKHWIGPAPTGRAALCGWWQGGALIQSGLGAPHDDLHHDYATTCILIMDTP